MSCDRCGFTVFRELYIRPNGTGEPALTNEKLGQTWWTIVDGQRIRICLGCVAELRSEKHKVEVR